MLSREGPTAFPLHERSIHRNISNMLICTSLMAPCPKCNHAAIYFRSVVLRAIEVTSFHRTALPVKIYITMQSLVIIRNMSQPIVPYGISSHALSYFQSQEVMHHS